LIRYCEKLKGDNPELSKKAICEKASNIFNVSYYSVFLLLLLPCQLFHDLSNDLPIF
jgi:hypothetical protein